jgi:hypothetical protein
MLTDHLFVSFSSLSTQCIRRRDIGKGFNGTASDERAVEIADEVMKAMGGRKAWDNTRFISWNFFGSRHLLWDKETGRVRIEVPQDSTVYLIDIDDDSGQVMKNGSVIENPDSLAKYVRRGKSIWINDSYWLVMPYKLKDSGVTLKYLGKDTTQRGSPADVLELTFENVGNTPENKYHVYVDEDSHLVTQWSYFRNAADEQPRFTTSWEDYQQHGDILLSGSRGERKLSDIRVHEQVPDLVFETFDPVDYRELTPTG